MVEPNGTLFGKPCWRVIVRGKNESELGELYNWCDDNLGAWEWYYDGYGRFVFNVKNEAMRFKLMFG